MRPNKNNFAQQLSIVIMFILTFCCMNFSMAQKNYWTSFNVINDSLQKEPKPLMIFIHTNWCKYCKMQEETTFSDTTLLDSLSQHYYCLKLDAESKEKITLLNHTFNSSPTDYHQLALMMGTTNKSNTLTFPSSVFLEPTLNVIYLHKGLLSKKQLSHILHLK